jgi:hypothetical protein
VRWARFRRLNLLFTIGIALLIAAWIFAGPLGIPLPSWIFVAGALVLVAANVALALRTFRMMRADSARVLAAHAGSVAFPSGIASWPGSDRAQRESIIAVTADRRGLSFRDDRDHEVLLVPADRDLSLELAPLEPRRIRPFRVTTIDMTVDFTGPPAPDAQVDAIVALRTALGRPAG